MAMTVAEYRVVMGAKADGMSDAAASASATWFSAGPRT